jgi:hypothetical protein
MVVHIKHPRTSYNKNYSRVIKLAYNIKVEFLISFHTQNIDLIRGMLQYFILEGRKEPPKTIYF